MNSNVAESLAFSWLRHVQGCQIVQSNWKALNDWQVQEEEEVAALLQVMENHLGEKYSDLKLEENSDEMSDLSERLIKSPLMRQGECDVIGLNFTETDSVYPYAVEMAFHKNGLGYKDNEKAVLKKMARAVLSLVGYFGLTKGRVIFATPKISETLVRDRLDHAITDLQTVINGRGYDFKMDLFYGKTFYDKLLQPLQVICDVASDDSEIFLRGCLLQKMCAGKEFTYQDVQSREDDIKWQEFKVGRLAKSLIFPMLANGAATAGEVKSMQEKDYSNKTFGLRYPLLKLKEDNKRPPRYYKDPVIIDETAYYACCEWYEEPCRKKMLQWIEEHRGE